MAFNTRPRLSNDQFRQLNTDSLTLSGTNNFVGTFQLKGIPLIVTGATNGHVLTYQAGQIKLLAASGGTSTGRGNAIVDNLTKSAHGFATGNVIGHNLTGYMKTLAIQGEPEAIGIVSKSLTSNTFEITYAGYITGLTGSTAALGVTGSTAFSANTTYYLSPFQSGKLTAIEPSEVGQITKPMLVTITNNDGIVVNWRGAIITSSGMTGGVSGASGVIGNAEDGDYTDGLFVDFTPTTPVGTAIDRFNEILKALAPSPAPNLSSLSRTSVGTYSSGRLSFGVSRNDIGYANVSNIAGNGALDINGTYTVGSTRFGITNAATISGVMNDTVNANSSHSADAFGDGDIGQLEMYLNGVQIDVLPLSDLSDTSSSFMTASAVSAVTTANGSFFNTFKYRKGTYSIGNSEFTDGFNYLRIVHNKFTSSATTAYVEWVYDSESTAMAFVNTPTFTNINLTGSKYVSGVRYHTGGTVVYSAITSNVYKNVYSASASAISFPTRTNLGDATSIIKTGIGVISETNSSKNLPILNSAVSNAQNTNLTIQSTHQINSSKVLGQFGTLGSLYTNLSLLHPLKTTLVGGGVTATGFLLDSAIQSNTLNNENFDGEINRIHNIDYLTASYSNLNGSTYAWDSTQSLVGVTPTHNNGLLVFNGELLFPSSTYLSSVYGITLGNFGAVSFGHAGNPNYSSATGIRQYNRKFKSVNAVTQSTITIDIIHDGTTTFLTNGGTGGTITGNNIKLEGLIKRSGGSTHGYFNPFATSGNPEGIANTSTTSIAGGTRVTCTLSTIPRIGNNDIVVLRVRASSGWTGVIANIQITNI